MACPLEAIWRKHRLSRLCSLWVQLSCHCWSTCSEGVWNQMVHHSSLHGSQQSARTDNNRQSINGICSSEQVRNMRLIRKGLRLGATSGRPKTDDPFLTIMKRIAYCRKLKNMSEWKDALVHTYSNSDHQIQVAMLVNSLAFASGSPSIHHVCENRLRGTPSPC